MNVPGPIGRRFLLGGAALLAMAAAPDSPAAPIEALNAGLLAAMRAGKSVPFAQRAAALAPAVDGAFDLHAILQATIGPRWSGLPENQKSALFAAFRDFTIASWVANFDSFDGQSFVVDPATRKVGPDVVVQTRIVPKSGDPTRLDYVMRPQGGGWKAVDVLVDGAISRVAIQRSDFRSLMKEGDASALTAMLRGKTSGLAGGEKP